MDKNTPVTLFLLLFASACSPNLAVRANADRTALLEAAATYHASASAKDAPAVVAMYDDDAMMIPPNAARVEGIEGIRDYRFGFIETPGVELEFETIRAQVSSGGDMGWTLAIGNITINRPDGEPGRDVVRDFHVWKKQDDGSWKVVVDMWNSEPPPTESRVP